MKRSTTLPERQAQMRKRQSTRSRRGRPRGWRKRDPLSALRWWMTERLQEGHSPASVAQMVRDELNIRPEQVRSWLCQSTALLSTDAG